ncbi:uncharacterized protein YbaR (Trm112 family) [Lysobacter niastensis]|uniref:Uncharacterized protein YbaR (Trm112 family) n=1 Tax=Lysobacter niastensis TaxID=380629 RepID=A0ABU1WEU7_9GAMM|nr:hypothetical protein [Lysobacter niastensis]MDR7136124.1 uncharacterized protein YbaR (Trm112 family) [Lysobacter niastensis]
MSTPRPGTPGATRTCPHCKTTILESSTVCPACKHHLRFDPAAEAASRQRSVPLRVEGTITPPDSDTALEYAMVLTIVDDNGRELERQVVGVGALYAGDKRTFTLSVEAVEIKGIRAPRGRGKH